MSSRHSVPAHKLAAFLSATPSPARVPAHLLVMALVFLGAIAVGYLLLPDENERIAMLEGDGHDAQALSMLEQRFAAGDRGQRTLYQLRHLYEEKGDIARATQMLELLAAARPRDANVQRHLAELYRATQNEPAYIAALERRLAGRASQPVCKELIGIYRGKGDFVAEQRTLDHCKKNGYRRTDDIIRLAHLTAVDGKTAEAARLLKSVDDRRRLRLDSDRLMLFAALIEADDADDAKRRAARWFKGSKDDTLVLQMIDTLAASGRDELAIDLAAEVGRAGDAITLAISELMLDRGEVEATRALLADWLAHAKLGDAELAQRFVRAALDAEDPLLAYRGARAHGLERLSQEDLVSLAEALSAIERSNEFRLVSAFITSGSVAGNLLLSAAINVEHGQAEPARQLLSQIEVKALDDWRLALWARLMASTGRKETAEQTLREIAAGVQDDDVSFPTAEEPAAEPTEAAAAPPVAAKAAHAPAAATRRAHTRKQSSRRRLGAKGHQSRLIRRQKGRSAPRRSRWRRTPNVPVTPPPQPQAPQITFPIPG